MSDTSSNEDIAWAQVETMNKAVGRANEALAGLEGKLSKVEAWYERYAKGKDGGEELKQILAAPLEVSAALQPEHMDLPGDVAQILKNIPLK